MKITVRKPTEQEREEAKTWSTWSKEKSTFPWEYFEKETCLIIEGKAKVKTSEEAVVFGKGDYVIFPEGLKCTWEIVGNIKKYYKFG